MDSFSKKDLFYLWVHVSVWVCAHEFKYPCRSEVSIRSVGAGVQIVMSQPIWVLGTGSSAKAALALTIEPSSQVLTNTL